MNSPYVSVVVAGAEISAARLVVVLFVVVRAHVKDGEQTASQFDYCTLLVCILTLPSVRRHCALTIPLWPYDVVGKQTWLVTW